MYIHILRREDAADQLGVLGGPLRAPVEGLHIYIYI